MCCSLFWSSSLTRKRRTRGTGYIPGNVCTHTALCLRLCCACMEELVYCVSLMTISLLADSAGSSVRKRHAFVNLPDAIHFCSRWCLCAISMIVTAGLQQGLVEPSGYGSIKLEHFPLLCRTKEQHRSMLLYLLMTALIAEDYNLGKRQFESLRATLKLTPQDLVTSYR